jgi:hypothetical protein
MLPPEKLVTSFALYYLLQIAPDQSESFYIVMSVAGSYGRYNIKDCSRSGVIWSGEKRETRDWNKTDLV